jgi:hypothetical protein
MELIVTLILTLFAALVFYKKKSDKAEVDKKLIETKVKDHVLIEQQLEIESAIKTLDQGIEKMRKQRELELKKRKEKHMTLKERADRIKNRIK